MGHLVWPLDGGDPHSLFGGEVAQEEVVDSSGDNRVDHKTRPDSAEQWGVSIALEAIEAGGDEKDNISEACENGEVRKVFLGRKGVISHAVRDLNSQGDDDGSGSQEIRGRQDRAVGRSLAQRGDLLKGDSHLQIIM